ncbi:MAG: tetratricopeptide repeat protein [Armatimonadetes bacterium]|nr:tetratricopeptide repeat protein [Armatimonadota bacterium]
MIRFQLADPDGYLLPLVAAAVGSGASFVKVRAEQGGLTVDFDGRPWSYEELKDLFGLALESGDRRHRDLAIGLHGCLQAEPAWVSVETWGGSAGTRLKIEGGDPRVERLSRAPWKDGAGMTRVRIQSSSRGLFGNIFGAKTEELPKPAAILRKRCSHAPLRLELNDQVVDTEVRLGRCLVWVHLEGHPSIPGSILKTAKPNALGSRTDPSAGWFSAVLGIGGEPEGELAFYLCINGVNFTKNLPLLGQLGVRGAVAAPDLRPSDDWSEVEEDENFQKLLEGLEQEVVKLGDDLVHAFDDMTAIDRVEATEYIKVLGNIHCELGKYPEAEELYVKLLQGQEESLGHDEPELANTLCRLGELREALGKFDECFEVYERAVSLWEDSSVPNEMLMAICLHGMASYKVNAGELAEAEEYAEQGLKLRKKHLAEDAIEVGSSHELLARIYRQRHHYPDSRYLKVEDLYKKALDIFEAHFGFDHPDVATLVHDLGDYYRTLRQYERAEFLLKQALEIRTGKLGAPDDPALPQALETLGRVYEEQGKAREAGQQYQRALEILEAQLGPDDPEVVGRLNNLVIMYRMYGRYGDAEPLYERMLELRENSLGPDHLDLVPDLCSLGLLYQVQDKYDQAEVVFKRAVGILEASLEPDHPETAWVLNHLGELNHLQGRYEEAEQVLERATAMWERVLGPDHPDVAVSLDYLVMHHREREQFEQALPYARRALDVRIAHLGAQHNEIATCLNTLGEILRAQDHLEEARAFYSQAYSIRQKCAASDESAEDLPQVAQLESSRYAAAKLEAEQLHREAVEPAKIYSRYPEAENLYLRALFAREQGLGPAHPNVARSLDSLAALYRTHRKYGPAEQLYRRSLALRQRSLGAEHPDVCLSLHSLIEILLLQGKDDEAEPFVQEWIEVVEHTLGSEHPELADALTKLAEIRSKQEKPEEVVELHKRAMEIRHAALGTEHPDFAMSLGELLILQGNYEEAAKLYGFVVNSLEESLGPEAPELVPALERYAGILKQLGRESAAAQVETQAMVLRVQSGMDFLE